MMETVLMTSFLPGPRPTSPLPVMTDRAAGAVRLPLPMPCRGRGISDQVTPPRYARNAENIRSNDGVRSPPEVRESRRHNHAIGQAAVGQGLMRHPHRPSPSLRKVLDQSDGSANRLRRHRNRTRVRRSTANRSVVPPQPVPTPRCVGGEAVLPLLGGRPCARRSGSRRCGAVLALHAPDRGRTPDSAAEFRRRITMFMRGPATHPLPFKTRRI